MVSPSTPGPAGRIHNIYIGGGGYFIHMKNDFFPTVTYVMMNQRDRRPPTVWRSWRLAITYSFTDRHRKQWVLVNCFRCFYTKSIIPYPYRYNRINGTKYFYVDFCGSFYWFSFYYFEKLTKVTTSIFT